MCPNIDIYKATAYLYLYVYVAIIATVKSQDLVLTTNNLKVKLQCVSNTVYLLPACMLYVYYNYISNYFILIW